MEGTIKKNTTLDKLKERVSHWLRSKAVKWYACQYCKEIQPHCNPSISKVEASCSSLPQEMGEEYGWTD